jgi:transcriptional regulator with XRE-family HTH domain
VKVLDRVQLRQKRKEKGLTRKQLADILGVNKSAVGQWELGRTSPKPSNLEKIVKLLGKDVLREKIHTKNEKLYIPTEQEYKEDVKKSQEEEIDSETLKKLEEEANYLNNIRNVLLGRV